MRKVILISLLFFSGMTQTFSRDIDIDSLGTEIDSTYLKKLSIINDYSLLGVQYGVALSNVTFQPDHSQTLNFVPVNIGIMFTKYGKLFGYMPYFGMRIGLFYTEEVLQFKKNEETGRYPYYILGAARREMKVLELPFLSHFHYDFWKMRIMADVGVYAGYRLTIERSEYVDKSPEMTQYSHSFHPREHRFDYGLKAGAGFAFIFDPVELHLMAGFKYSWSNLFDPNVNYRYEDSPYYYNWANPMNIIISLGVHYQLTKRVGYTKRQLKEQAREEALVYLAELRERETKELAEAVKNRSMDAGNKDEADDSDNMYESGDKDIYEEDNSENR